MSKRKSGTTAQPFKRHKASEYDGKTQLQREMEYFTQHEAQQEQEEFIRAQQELQQKTQQRTPSNNNIQYGSSDDDDDDVDVNHANGVEERMQGHDDDDNEHGKENENNARDADYAPQLPAPHAHTHPERLGRIRDTYGGGGEDHESDRGDHHHGSHGHDYTSSSSRQHAHTHTHSHSQSHTHASDAPDHDEAITLKDLRNVQMKRDQMEKICSEPYFGEFVSRVLDEDGGCSCPGFFCRMFIGERATSQGGSTAVYRICEIVGVDDYPRAYTLTTSKKQTVNIALLLAHGRQQRMFKIIQASNQPFTEQEFEAWQQAMRDDGVCMPSRDALNEKYMAAIKMHRNFKYDETQIAILKAKKNRNFDARTLANPHREKLKVSALVQSLAEDDAQRPRYVLYLSEINAEIERRSSLSSQAVKVSIAAINERNKLKNKELMLKAREKERKEKFALRMKGSVQTKDPFTRAITAPQIESFNNLVFDEEPSASQQPQALQAQPQEQQKANMDEMNAMQKAKHELQNLSILQLQRNKHHDKGLKEDEDDGAYDNDADNAQLLIGDDRLWSVTVHEVAQQFMQKCSEIVVDGECEHRLQLMRKQAQFGRNTNKSKYGHVFTRKPNDLRIISIDEYLQTQKYDRQ